MKINKQAKREAKQLFHFCLVNGLLDENRVRNVARHVVAGGRRDDLAILTHFRRLVKLEIAQRTATVESAVPLPADLQRDLDLTRRQLVEANRRADEERQARLAAEQEIARLRAQLEQVRSPKSGGR